MFLRTPYPLTPTQEAAVQRGVSPKPPGSKIVVAPFIKRVDRLTHPWYGWTLDSLLTDPWFARRYGSDVLEVEWFQVQPTTMMLIMSETHANEWYEPHPNDLDAKIHYHVHDSDLMDFLHRSNKGMIYETFTIVKRGTKYGIKVVK